MDKKERSNNKPKKYDGSFFQYTAAVALNYGKVESHPENVSNIMPFINKYNWGGIKYQAKVDEWKMFYKNNPTIALNDLYIK